MRYEFGVEVAIVKTLKEGGVVEARRCRAIRTMATRCMKTGQAAILLEVELERMFVARGYKGVGVDHARIGRSGQKRGVTCGHEGMICRRSAIKPTLGLRKSDGSSTAIGAKALLVMPSMPRRAVQGITCA